MKSRMTLIFATLVVLLGTMIWVVQDRRATGPVPVIGSVVQAVEPAVQPFTASTSAAPTVSPQSSPAAPETVAGPAMVHVNIAGSTSYIARSGDTVAQLAVALLGSDSREHRDAVIAADRSLQANPDRVIEGQTYSITPSNDLPATAITPQPAAPVIASDNKTNKSVNDLAGPKLRYTAQPGDTVGGLATDLLGADTKANRAAITASNASLREDPDHLVAGKSYTIVAKKGLVVDADAHPAVAPATQPDDAAPFSTGKTLRYTAKPGDTVSSITTALFGSDTAANRQLIIKSNSSLRRDIDHVVAGQTYWILVPTGDEAP